MTIYHKYKLIHVHIPKCGGQGVEPSLGVFFELDKIYFEYSWGLYKHYELQHLTCQQMLNLNIISKKLFDRYYKFAVIRNPYERLISAITWLYKVSDIDKVREYAKKINYESVLHVKPQHLFLYDKDGNIMVNEVFKMEKYQKMIDMLKEKTGKSIDNVKHNASNRKKDYMVYFDQELLDFTNNFYAKDFELLGYEKVKQNKSITPIITALNSPYLSKTNSGMGNILFQVSSTLGIAKKLGIGCSFPFLVEYMEKMKKLYNQDFSKNIYRNVPIGDTTSIKYTKEIIESKGSKEYSLDTIKYIENNNTNIKIRGYLENDLYFENIKPEIKEMFEPNPESLKYINEKYSKLLQNKDITLVSLHYRGNEFIKNHCKINNNYYKNAYNHIKSCTKNPYFLVFTDDVSCVDITVFDNDFNYTVIEGNPDYIDLWLMGMCKYNILSGSTFSFWGAFLSNNPDNHILYDKEISYHYLLRYKAI